MLVGTVAATGTGTVVPEAGTGAGSAPEYPVGYRVLVVADCTVDSVGSHAVKTAVSRTVGVAGRTVVAVGLIGWAVTGDPVHPVAVWSVVEVSVVD